MQGDTIPALDEKPQDILAQSAQRLIARFEAAADIEAYNDIMSDDAAAADHKKIKANKRRELEDKIATAQSTALARITKQAAA